jgi:hypothetical protein
MRYLSKARLALACSLLALAGCASAGSSPKMMHQPSDVESCRQSDCTGQGTHWLLRHLPIVGSLFEPVGLGPCLPATDDGQPQSCGGWPVFGPGAHALGPLVYSPRVCPAAEALPSCTACKTVASCLDYVHRLHGTYQQLACAEEGCMWALPWPGASPADCEAQRSADGSQMSPKECYAIIGMPPPQQKAPSPTPVGPLPSGPGSGAAPPPAGLVSTSVLAVRRPTFAEFLLRLRSRDTYDAVIHGGSW